MALLFTDGFEGYSSTVGNMLPVNYNSASTSMAGKWVGLNQTYSISTATFFTTQPNGYSAAFAVGNPSSYGCLSIPNTSNVYVGFNFKTVGTSWTNNLFYLSSQMNTTPPTLGLRISVIANGSIKVQTATGGTTFITTPPALFVASTWYSIELNAVYGSGTSGSVELRVNGVSYTATGIDSTGGIGGTGYSYAYLWCLDSNSGVSYFDDLYVFDNTGTANNTFNGSSSVYTLFPASNGTTNNFSPVGAVSNWQCVSPTSWSITRYIQTSTTSQKDLYNLNAISATPASVNAVVVTSLAVKEANAPNNITNQCVVGGTTANGATIAATTAFTKDQDVFVNQPNGTAWTKAAVNAMQIGITT